MQRNTGSYLLTIESKPFDIQIFGLLASPRLEDEGNSAPHDLEKLGPASRNPDAHLGSRISSPSTVPPSREAQKQTDGRW